MDPSGEDEIDDVPSPIDLRERRDAEEWVASAERKRPWRTRFRAGFADLLRTAVPAPARVLELGGGPGLLAETILGACALRDYTLLDFSDPMLEMARRRLSQRSEVSFVLADFKRPGWTEMVRAGFDAVVAMQAVHEIRHKRHVPRLYREIRNLLQPGGSLIVCDHTPPDDSPRFTALCMTEAEQHDAFRASGFDDVRTALMSDGMYLCVGTTQRRRADESR
jgi:ubiquinone/menaquinone biosynthesis C-methylase UbiE